MYDEMAGAKGIMEVAYPAVKAVSPQTLIAQTQMPSPSYAQWVDITIPTIPAVDNPEAPREYATKMRSEGKHPWFYSCVSYGITLSEVGVRDPLIPLAGYNGEAEGYLFWALNWYKTPQPGFPITSWNEYRSLTGINECTGDGTLIYPPAHPGGTPMPSSRLKVFRDGMEDYEFLHELKALYAQKSARLTSTEQQAVLSILDINPMMTAAWENPELVVQRRAEAGRWIDRLAKM